MTALASPTDMGRAVLGRAAGWFVRPMTPVPLALLRIGVFAGFIYLYSEMPATRFAEHPESLEVPPAYMGWLLAAIPRGPVFTAVMSAVMLAAAAAAMVGWKTRITAPVAVIAGFYVLGLMQLFGRVSHFHHVLVFGAIVAVAPSGDALSLDARRERPGPSAAYGFPVRMAWLILGLIYLSAAIPKVDAGFDWVLTDNLRNHMWASWYLKENFTPLIRLDSLFMSQLLALATIVFELGFLPAMFFRRTRLLFAVGGVVFHVGTAFAIGIEFWHLLACYGMFVPADALRTGFRRGPGMASAAVCVSVLVAVAAVAVVGNTRGWPVAAYPRFAIRHSPIVTEYEYRLNGEPLGGGGLGDEVRLQSTLGVIRDDPEHGDAIADYLGGGEWVLLVRRVWVVPGFEGQPYTSDEIVASGYSEPVRGR